MKAREKRRRRQLRKARQRVRHADLCKRAAENFAKEMVELFGAAWWSAQEAHDEGI